MNPRSNTDAELRDSANCGTVRGLSLGLDRGSVRATELVERLIEAASATAATVNAFVEIHHDEALAEALAADERASAGRRLSAIDGIPFGIKDLIGVRGHTMLAGSRA